MGFFQKLFGFKKAKAIEPVKIDERALEEQELIAAGILKEKDENTAIRTKKETSQVSAKKPSSKNETIKKQEGAKAKNTASDQEKSEKIKKEENPPDTKAEDFVEEKSVEEIDAVFTEEKNEEISAEVAKAEAKSGRALARFEIKKSKDNRFVFNLYAPNRVIVATSQIYSSSPSAVNGIKSIATNAPKAPIEDTSLKSFAPVGFPKWEIYVDKGGKYRFRLYAPNGSCIVHSQGYTTKASCKNGIASIVKNAPDAIIDKSYLKKDSD